MRRIVTPIVLLAVLVGLYLIASAGVVTVDEYGIANGDGSSAIYAGAYYMRGQSFACVNAVTLDSCTFAIYKVGSPTGGVTAEIFAETHATDYGVDSRGTGNALAISDTIDASTLGLVSDTVSFAFSGANKISLEASTYYVAVVKYNDGDASNYVKIVHDESSPSHAGNYVAYNGSWDGTTAWDCVFYVFGTTGAAQGDTSCAVYTSPLAFGSVDTGSTALDSFYIKNDGDSALIDTVRWSGVLSVFTPQSDSAYSLSAGDSAYFSVQFAPVAVTSYEDDLDLGHDSCGTITLSGSGRAVAPSGGNTFYLDNYGSDDSTGASPATAWKTLQKAQAEMDSGDTLLIMGGNYTGEQYFRDATSDYEGLLIKAYGDSVAYFTNTRDGVDEYSSIFIYISGGSDSVIIDGFSYLDPDSAGWLSFEIDTLSNSIIKITGSASDYAVNARVRGVVLDGNSGDLHDNKRTGQGIWFSFCQNSLIEHCTISQINHPSGPIAPGDDSDTSQGSGNGIQICSCIGVIIRNNTLTTCNHTAINLGADTGAEFPCSQYITIKDNYINNGWGGGIYITCEAEYCLVDNNVIVNCGATTTFNKPGIQVSGPHNVIRRNIVYNPDNNGIDMEAQSYGYYDYIIDSCLVYNNTVFNSGGKYSLKIFVNNSSDATCSGENMLIANNIFYKSTGSLDVNATPEIYMPLGNANDAHNWLDPDNSGTEPYSTHWGNNTFYNNCIRRNSDGSAHDSLITFIMDADYGGATRRYSLDSVQSQDTTAWHDNIGTDPMLTSEAPDSYGLNSGWWYLRAGSPCIDAGAFMGALDTIGAYVESQAPGYGWDSLSVKGDAPDIGAYESEQSDTCCAALPTTHDYGNVSVGSTSDYDFYVSNCGDSTLYLSIELSDSTEFNIQSGGGLDTLIGSAACTVTVQFAPTSSGEKLDTLTLGNAACSSVPLSGTGTAVSDGTGVIRRLWHGAKKVIWMWRH